MIRIYFVFLVIIVFCFRFPLCDLCLLEFIILHFKNISRTRHGVRNRILTDIKESFFIDADCQEMQDIKYAVEKYLWQICEKLDLPYKIKKTILGGSVGENTRLWDSEIKPFVAENNKPFVEFDFLAVMHMNDIQIARRCNGYMGVTENRKKLSDRQHPVDRDVVDGWLTLFAFANNMKKVIDSNTLQEIISTPSGNLSLDRSKGSIAQYRYTIWFNWESKVQNIRPPDIYEQKWKTFGVHVDFLPAIEFKHGDVIPTDADKGWAETRDFDCSRFLVPKPCRYCHYTCWKVSTMLEEQQMIKKASRVHLKAYMFLKFFLSLAESKDYIPATTYMMKAVFLDHLRDNKCPPSGETVQNCLSALFNSLSTMFKNQCIPHYFFRYNLLKRESNLRTPKLLRNQSAGNWVAAIDSRVRDLDYFQNKYPLRCLLEEMTKSFKLQNRKIEAALDIIYYSQ